MKTFKNFLNESEGDYLYHATYRIHKDSIAKHGLKANSDHKNWSDSKKGRIYFAKNAEEALSHAETSDEVSDKHYNSGIVVYKVHKKNLDVSKMHKDTNNPSADTIEYHADINPEHLQIHSEHNT